MTAREAHERWDRIASVLDRYNARTATQQNVPDLTLAYYEVDSLAEIVKSMLRQTIEAAQTQAAPIVGAGLVNSLRIPIPARAPIPSPARVYTVPRPQAFQQSPRIPSNVQGPQVIPQSPRIPSNVQGPQVIPQSPRASNVPVQRVNSPPRIPHTMLQAAPGVPVVGPAVAPQVAQQIAPRIVAQPAPR